MVKFTITLGLLLCCSYSFAAEWVSNRDHSEIMFQIPYMSVSEISGRFNEFTAKADFDEKELLFKSLSVQILTKSIDTGNKMRDGHLEGHDFLQGDVHPYITFTAQTIKKVAGKTFKASGVLTIKGLKKLHEIEFSLTDSLKDTWGYENRFVKFSSTVNRKDYNITWNKTLDGKEFLVGDKVSFRGTFQLQPAGKVTPNSKHMIPDTEQIRKNDSARLNAKEEEESFLSRKIRALINGK